MLSLGAVSICCSSDSPTLKILSILCHELTLDQWLGIKRATNQRSRFFFILATLSYIGIFLLIIFILKVNKINNCYHCYILHFDNPYIDPEFLKKLFII